MLRPSCLAVISTRCSCTRLCCRWPCSMTWRTGRPTTTTGNLMQTTYFYDMIQIIDKYKNQRSKVFVEELKSDGTLIRSNLLLFYFAFPRWPSESIHPAIAIDFTNCVEISSKKKQILDHPVPTTIMKNVYDDVYLGV